MENDYWAAPVTMDSGIQCLRCLDTGWQLGSGVYNYEPCEVCEPGGQAKEAQTIKDVFRRKGQKR
jgi:hypothetical protein